MKHLLIVISLFLSVNLFSQIPSGYYNGTDGLQGDNLRDKLKQIISSGHTQNDYGDLYGYYQSTDNYTGFGDNRVWDMYSMHNDGTANYWYPHKNKKSVNEDKNCDGKCTEGGGFNREHSVPQSWFSSHQPMKADLFIVYPTDACINGMRGHHPFGETDSPNWTSTNGSKRGPCSYPDYVNDTNIGNISGEDDIIFEPIDRFKGDFARTYFYTVTRYKDQISTWTENVAPDVFEGDNLEPWVISLFLKWHREDPVSQKEIDRNNAAYTIQHNRNPFIDHPEWVECIWAGNCIPLYFSSTPITSVMIPETYTYNITYNVDTDTETLTGTTIPSWLTFTKDEANNTALLTGTPTSADIGTHNVVLTLTEGSETVTQNFNIEVVPFNTTQDIIDVDFTTCPPENWTTYSVSSNENWNCDAQTYSVNGYNGNEASNDWFISPSLNLQDYINEVLTFKTWTQYSDGGITDPEVKLKYSTNYSGSGDPTSATWTEINYTYSAEDSQSWTNSGNIDLSNINESSVYLAFQYLSSGIGAGTSAYWKIDDILLQGDVIVNVEDINSKIKIYPNPTKQTINISSFNKITNVNIYNVIGQKMFSLKDIHKNELSINMTNFTKGIYFIEIKDINIGIVLKKLIKE